MSENSSTPFWKSNAAMVLAVAVIAVFALTFTRTRGSMLDMVMYGEPAMNGKMGQVERYGGEMESAQMALDVAPTSAGMRVGTSLPYPEDVPPVETDERLVIENSSLSLLVEDVSASVDRVRSAAESVNGFLVNSNVHTPEDGAAFGTITVRVPNEQRSQVLAQLRDMSVRVINENIDGRDVTDQYVDLQSRLAVLEETKARFEVLLDQATEIDDLLRVQRELVNLQRQIDSLKGQQEYLEKSAQLSLISVSLSTDELALPYAPDNAWRPQVVYKQAVRSLVRTVRGFGSFAIWSAVYAPVWVPVVAVGVWLKRRSSR